MPSLELCVMLASMLACQTLRVRLILLVSHAAWMTDLVLDVACALIGSLHSKL